MLPPPPNNAPAAALLITAGSPSASAAASTRRSTAADSPFGLDRTPTIAASARRSIGHSRQPSASLDGLAAAAAGGAAGSVAGGGLAAVGGAYSLNLSSLRAAWEATQRSTRDDWREWTRRLAVELLRQSPEPSLRACAPLAGVYPPLAWRLFNAAFLSCWGALGREGAQQSLVASLETALDADGLSPELLADDAQPVRVHGAR